jgi:hypothetical protein
MGFEGLRVKVAIVSPPAGNNALTLRAAMAAATQAA